MQKNIFYWRQTVALIMSLLVLNGCDDIVPQRVDENIVIHRDGKIDVHYYGTFSDTYEILGSLGSRSVNLPSRDSFEKQILEKYLGEKGINTVLRTAANTYSLDYAETGSVSKGDFPSLLVAGSTLAERMPSFISFTRVDELELGFRTKENKTIKELKDLLKENNPTATVVRRMLDSLHGTLTIRIDAALVGDQNAQRVTHDKDGWTEYKWVIDKTTLSKVKFTFFLGEHDSAMNKLLTSPPGSDCMKVIGSMCKCGPFVLEQMQTGESVGNRAYKITTSEGIQRGCSDKNGTIKAISVRRTGPCDLTMPPEDESDKLCRIPSKP